MAKAATRTKIKAANLPVPQNRNEAAAYLKCIGELNREIGRHQADMNDAMAKIKERFENMAAPLGEEVKAATEGLRIWCEANRQALTGGKVKSADLGTGEVEWRLNPPKVTIRNVEEVLAEAEAQGLERFIRVKRELNKEQMLAEADLARGLHGVTIGTSGEQFVVKPFEVELEGGQA